MAETNIMHKDNDNNVYCAHCAVLAIIADPERKCPLRIITDNYNYNICFDCGNYVNDKVTI